MTTLPFYLPKPIKAYETYLRIISINDVYNIENYACVETIIKSLKETAGDSVVVATLCGDFLSPCLLTSLDGGKSILEMLSVMDIDYISLGNHEFDVNFDVLQERFKNYKIKCLNGNISNLSIVDFQGLPLPKYDIIQVGNHKVAFTGFCTDNLDIFRPGINLNIEPVFDALKNIWLESVNKLNIVIPLTHQTNLEDIELAKKISKDDDLKGKVPVIIGGHDHEVYIEKVADTSIVKAGYEANNVAVVDVWWTDDNHVHSAAYLLPTEYFQPDPDKQILVEKAKKFLDSLMDVEIFHVKENMSSKRTRFQPSKVASTLCHYIKKSLPNIDIVMVQGGCIRGDRDYQANDSFTYGHLLSEMPFDSQIAIIKIPGKVLQDAISLTRSTPEESNPGYLHTDLDTTIEDYPSLKIIKINNQPFDPDKMYNLGVYQFLLMGLDEVKPLVDYANNNVNIPTLEQCIPSKNLILESCMKNAWRDLVDFEAWDSNKDGQISKQELEKAVEKVFASLDTDQDGYISPHELQEALGKKTGNSDKNLIDMMFEFLDANNDGLVSMEELASLAM